MTHHNSNSSWRTRSLHTTPSRTTLRACCSTLSLLALLLLADGAFAQMPGMGAGMGGGGINIGGGRGHGSDDAKNLSCPPSGAVGRIDVTEDARDRLETLRSKINPSAEQIPFWNKYDIAASRAVEDSKRWRNRDHRQDQQRGAVELDAMLLDELRDRLTALEDVEATGAALYHTLDPSQRELADRQMPAIVSALAGNPVLVFDSQ
jgi:hypothetical protein